MPTHRDANHAIVRDALKHRCGGFHKDKEHPHYYANIQGIKVAAYDLHAAGHGIPDWLVFVGTFAIFFEVKQPRPAGGKFGPKRTLTDQQYYFGQLEDTETFFYWHHPSITAIVWDQNQVYDWLKLCAEFVNHQEGTSESAAFLKLFFPKVIISPNKKDKDYVKTIEVTKNTGAKDTRPHQGHKKRRPIKSSS